MKSLLLTPFILSIVSFIPIGSCEEPPGVDDSRNYNNYGYAGVVDFPLEGDTIVLNGENAFKEISIKRITYSDVICANVGKWINGDTITVWYDWLTAKTVEGSHSLTLIAKPSKSGVVRQLEVKGTFVDENDYVEYAVIFVDQH